MNDRSTHNHMYSSIDTTRAMARVEGRLNYLLGHRELPPHFTQVIEDCLADCRVAHDTHQQTLDYHKQHTRDMLQAAIHNTTPIAVT